MNGGYRSVDPPPDGPLMDELKIREQFTRDMNEILLGMLIPVSAIVQLKETVEHLTKEAPDSPGFYPIIEGVRPVALLWKHDCRGHEDGEQHEPQWYLVPLLEPFFDEPNAEMSEIAKTGMDFVAAMVRNQLQWKEYVQRWGSMP